MHLLTQKKKYQTRSNPDVTKWRHGAREGTMWDWLGPARGWGWGQAPSWPARRWHRREGERAPPVLRRWLQPPSDVTGWRHGAREGRRWDWLGLAHGWGWGRHHRVLPGIGIAEEAGGGGHAEGRSPLVLRRRLQPPSGPSRNGAPPHRCATTVVHGCSAAAAPHRKREGEGERETESHARQGGDGGGSDLDGSTVPMRRHPGGRPPRGRERNTGEDWKRVCAAAASDLEIGRDFWKVQASIWKVQASSR
jgi:hypothetical protein